MPEERGTMHLEKPLWRDEKTARLLEAMLSGEIGEIKPVIDPDREMGYSYRELSRVLDIPDKEAQQMLDSLAGQSILEKAFVEKYIRCPQCQSLNLAPGYYCVKCSSGRLSRGRVLVHSVCEYAGAEEEFNQSGRLVCPKCYQEVKVIGQDYTSLGVMRKCRDCGEIFAHPSIKWRCLKCTAVTSEDKVVEVDAHSYSLPEREEIRLWLRFELGHKPKLIKFLQERGFEVTENARVAGRSGAEHEFDMLAVRDDGVTKHRIAVGIENSVKELGIDRVFSFDDKAYDCGIHDKILVVLPQIKKEAEALAEQQRIKVIQSWDLEAVLGIKLPSVESPAVEEAFKFHSKSGLIDYLQKRGYEVEQQAVVRGKSGADHTFDILASRDDGITLHRVAIGVEVSDAPISLEKVFAFDDKAYDCTIMNKVFIAVPGLGREGRRFADRQRIAVFEAASLEG
jgi:hypothetical protein